MSIILDINPVRQNSPNSCWWACMRMVFAYCDRFYHHPRDLSPAFGSWLDPNRPIPTLLYPPYLEGEEASDYDDLGHMRRDMILHPREWYRHGVPMTARGLRLLDQLTSFAPLPDRPGFGHWTHDQVEERLRRFGPFLFIGNWNGEGFHAVLVIGRERQDDMDEIVYIDPAMGAALNVSIAHFNRMMSGIGIQQGNPLYLPQAARRRRFRLDRCIKASPMTTSGRLTCPA